MALAHGRGAVASDCDVLMPLLEQIRANCCDPRFVVCNSMDPPRVLGVIMPSMQLQGEIPSDIGNLTLVTFLNLRHNALRGPLPENLGQLTRLSTLALWNNSLSGSI